MCPNELEYIQYQCALISMCVTIIQILTLTHSRTFGCTLVLIGKDFVPEHHTLSINLNNNFHNILTVQHWLRIHFRKVLTSLLWEMKKAIKTFITFFSFSIKTFFNQVLNQCRTALINISLLSNREKTRVYSTLVCWEINLFLMRYFLRKLGKAQGRLPRQRQ